MICFLIEIDALTKAPQVLQYDADGNLTNDGLWSYSWDGENRLTNVTTINTLPTNALVKVDYMYDWQGRRIQKLVSNWQRIELDTPTIAPALPMKNKR
jgi:YD repeat-containing protein